MSDQTNLKMSKTAPDLINNRKCVPPDLAKLKQLNQDEIASLAQELRCQIMTVVAKSGGHFASNLGVVELTIALLTAYELPQDRIIFDVGHQSYAWKLLTGRNLRFNTLRQKNGLSGYPRTEESDCDAFNTGHSSTSISAAIGIARALRLTNKPAKVAAVIGDGAMTGGMAFEALNELGASDEDVLVILNDNQMSISPNVGGLSAHLSKLRVASWYLALKRNWDLRLERMPFGRILRRIINSFRRWLRRITERQSSFFEAFGLKYYGPIDGHDTAVLTQYLTNIRQIKGPKLLHVVTVKGKGYDHAEVAPDKYHGVAAFEVELGLKPDVGSNQVTYSAVFGEKICELAQQDERVFAITAAMASGTCLERFAKEFPERFADVGIAEQHALTMAAGLAIAGMRPYVAIYSTFLQRGFDQLIHDIALQNLPVTLCVDRAGIVGDDGATHQGVYDLAFLRTVPNLQIFSPADEIDLARVMQYSLTAKHPVVIRYPRNVIVPWPSGALMRPETELMQPWIVAQGTDVLVVAVGVMVQTALLARKNLGEKSKYVAICSVVCTSQGLEHDIIKGLGSYQGIIVIEDGVLQGGFGEGIGSAICQLPSAERIEFAHYGVQNPLAEQASRSERLADERLDADGIALRMETMLEQLGY